MTDIKDGELTLRIKDRVNIGLRDHGVVGLHRVGFEIYLRNKGYSGIIGADDLFKYGQYEVNKNGRSSFLIFKDIPYSAVELLCGEHDFGDRTFSFEMEVEVDEDQVVHTGRTMMHGDNHVSFIGAAFWFEQVKMVGSLPAKFRRFKGECKDA